MLPLQQRCIYSYVCSIVFCTAELDRSWPIIHLALSSQQNREPNDAVLNRRYASATTAAAALEPRKHRTTLQSTQVNTKQEDDSIGAGTVLPCVLSSHSCDAILLPHAREANFHAPALRINAAPTQTTIRITNDQLPEDQAHRATVECPRSGECANRPNTIKRRVGCLYTEEPTRTSRNIKTSWQEHGRTQFSTATKVKVMLDEKNNLV